MARKADPAAGTVYGFATRSGYSWRPPTGRFGALKVLGTIRADHMAFGGDVAFATLDGVFDHLPSLEEVAALPVLALHRFGNFGGQPAVFATVPSWLADPELVELGVAPVTDGEAEILDSGIRSATSPLSARLHVEGEWRWANDREALEADAQRKREEDAEQRRVEQERFETRLKGLTWEQLLSEEPFARWDPSPPFPSAAFTAAATARVHDAMRELAALGPKPTKKAARAVLKHLVTWLNEADEAAGHPIETEEREDVILVLGEMAFVARQPTLMDEVDAWRAW